jgi:type IV pilus assembly protein PilV
MKGPQPQRGFTLISVLLAIVMLSIGLVALARTQSGLLASQQNTENRDVATAIALSYMEDLRGRDPATLVSEPPLAVDAEGQPFPGGPFLRTTTVTPDNPNLLRVEVQVAYPRGAQPIALTTLIFAP